MTKPSNKNIKKRVKCIYCNKMIDIKKTIKNEDTFIEIKCCNAPEIRVYTPPIIWLYAHTDCLQKTLN